MFSKNALSKSAAGRPRSLSRVRLIVNAACIFVALLAAVWILVGHRGEDSSLAFAAGSAKAAPKAAAAPAPAADAGAPAEAAPAEKADKTEKADKGEKSDKGDKEKSDKKKDEPPTPIDLAVAPNGGVPQHPGATHFKSPFAKPNAGPPVRVKVAMLLNTVDGYDIKTGTFTADFFVSLTSTEPMPPINLNIPNGSLDKKEDIADKPTFKLYRMSGTFKAPADLRKYPFDSQELKIVLEDDANGIDQVEFVVDKERTQLARGFRTVGWQVGYVDARVQSQAYPDRFENDDLFYSRYTFAVGIDRYATSAAFTVFVPAFVIVLISLLGMWVPAEEMEVRSNSGAPMLAGAVLFHFALMQELPATSYLTRADKLMLGVYISLALGMISTWWMFLVKEENIPTVFRIARVAVPVLSAIVMGLACFA